MALRMRHLVLLPLFLLAILAATERAATESLRLPQFKLEEFVGLEAAKAALQEALVAPATAPRLFWRSTEQSAVLLVGPSGLGKLPLAEAAANAAQASVIRLLATEVASRTFCQSALSTASSSGKPVVVLIESLEAAPSASLVVRQCLREVSLGDAQVYIVASADRALRNLDAGYLAPFGFIVELSAPSDTERRQFLKQLFTQVSRVDAQWGSALSQVAVDTLANLTAGYTYSEIDLVVRRAFTGSANSEGGRDPVALHHFEQILQRTTPRAVAAFELEPPSAQPPAAAGSPQAAGERKKAAKSGQDLTDQGIFGWCNRWLPEGMHLPPVVWAMIVFGILAHFMARSTYQPYGNKRRQGAGRSAGFGEMFGGGAGAGAGAGGGFPSFGDHGFGDFSGGGSPFGNFPPPPNMPGRGGGESSSAAPAAAPSAGGASAAPRMVSGPPTEAPPGGGSKLE